MATIGPSFAFVVSDPFAVMAAAPEVVAAAAAAAVAALDCAAVAVAEIALASPAADVPALAVFARWLSHMALEQAQSAVAAASGARYAMLATMSESLWMLGTRHPDRPVRRQSLGAPVAVLAAAAA